jgi:quinohemoprotein ethanol dehydrogenase
MRRVSRGWLAALAALACTVQAADTVVDDAYLRDGGDGTNWPSYGRASTEQRYSPLDRINAGNVNELGVQWVTELPDERSLIATPLAIDGVLYFTGSYSRTYAIDARTGKVLWTFDPKSIERAGDRLRVMWDINRGPAYYKGKLIISTVDGRLVALDARTGRQLWETMTVDPRKSYYVNGVPKVFRDKVGASSSCLATRPTASRTRPWRWRPRPGPASGGNTAAAATCGTA